MRDWLAEAPHNLSWYPFVKFISKNDFTASDVMPGSSVNFLLILSQRFWLMFRSLIYAKSFSTKKKKNNKTVALTTVYSVSRVPAII